MVVWSNPSLGSLLHKLVGLLPWCRNCKGKRSCLLNWVNGLINYYDIWRFVLSVLHYALGTSFHFLSTYLYFSLSTLASVFTDAIWLVFLFLISYFVFGVAPLMLTFNTSFRLIQKNVVLINYFRCNIWIKWSSKLLLFVIWLWLLRFIGNRECDI